MDKSMKAVVLTGNRCAEVREWPKPVAGPGQVVIEMKVSGLCGSDLHHFRRVPREGETLFVSGHEPCGLVHEVGSGVTHVQVGQRVCLYHYVGCGHCRWCAAGLMQHCPRRAGFGSPRLPGGDAEYMLVPAQCAFPMPESFSYIDGAFAACGAATSFRALDKLGVGPKQDLCIYGLGPVGLAALRLAKPMRVRKIIGVDPNPARRQMALDSGIDIVLDGGPDTAPTIRELTSGGAGCLLETSGSAAAQRNILDSAAHQAKVAVVGIMGLYDKKGEVNLSRLTDDEITVMGSFVIALPQYYELLEFMVEQDVHFDPLVTHRFPIASAQEAFNTFDAGSAGKVIFEF